MLKEKKKSNNNGQLTGAAGLFCCMVSFDGQICAGTVGGLIGARHLYAGFQVLTGCSSLMKVRNEAVHRFLKTKADRLWFLDDDVWFNPENLQKLLSNDVDIVGGVYARRLPGPKHFNVLPMPPDVRLPSDMAGCTGCQEVRGVATGFMAIKRRVFEVLEPHAVKYDQGGLGQVANYFPEGIEEGFHWSDDYAFCRLARKHGLKIHADLDVRLGHQGNQVY